MTRVKLPISLRRHAGGAALLTLSGTTVAQCLEELEYRFPSLSREMRDEVGALLASVNLYVNGVDVRYLSRLATIVESEDEVTIVIPVAGGCARSSYEPVQGVAR